MAVATVRTTTRHAPLSGAALRGARDVLRLSQTTAGRVLGGVRQETISRWEQRSRLRVQSILAQPVRELVEVADLLETLYPDEERRQRFLRQPQPGLRGRVTIDVLPENPPYGVHRVWELLMDIAHGLPA